MCIQIFPTIILTFDCRLSLVGKPKGRIGKKEIATLPDSAFYRVNEKAWFTEAVMLDWVKLILTPWAAKALPGIVPILLRDQFNSLTTMVADMRPHFFWSSMIG